LLPFAETIFQSAKIAIVIGKAPKLHSVEPQSSQRTQQI
jgi:hypothetical protein